MVFYLDFTDVQKLQIRGKQPWFIVPDNAQLRVCYAQISVLTNLLRLSGGGGGGAWVETVGVYA